MEEPVQRAVCISWREWAALGRCPAGGALPGTWRARPWSGEAGLRQSCRRVGSGPAGLRSPGVGHRGPVRGPLAQASGPAGAVRAARGPHLHGCLTIRATLYTPKISFLAECRAHTGPMGRQSDGTSRWHLVPPRHVGHGTGRAGLRAQAPLPTDPGARGARLLLRVCALDSESRPCPRAPRDPRRPRPALSPRAPSVRSPLRPAGLTVSRR
ncbi:PREDICTED: uncharacterized protein LOC106147115 [Chinchilla lanigera]|uniref:uncharacterized protein LOC106147115 n=1 Tax=Chinchilla lanigera TaxID=34839 RepID=UPI0006976AC4|nr:PREDICTED: uncharacterized protein LOC106147115 [Chinchilla lanigera]